MAIHMEGQLRPMVQGQQHASRPFITSIAGRGMVLIFAAMCVVDIATFGVQLVRVDGPSMEPALEDHDCLIVNRLVYELGTPQRGDIVTLYYPRDPDRMFVKRVIALEGEWVRIVDGRVYVDGKALRDNYPGPMFRSHDNWGPQLVSDGYYFVMGDHRNHSYDSREWGFVPRRYVIGKVTLRWWPLNHMTIF